MFGLKLKFGFRQGLLEGWLRVSVGFVLGFMLSWFGVYGCLV